MIQFVMQSVSVNFKFPVVLKAKFQRWVFRIEVPMFDTNSSLKNSDKSIKKEELKLTENFVVEFWNHAYIKMEPTESHNKTHLA